MTLPDIQTLAHRITAHMQPIVFFGSAGTVVGFILVGAFATEWAAQTFETVRLTISDLFGWYYVLAATGFVAFALWLLVGRAGDIKLGAGDEEPEFGLVAWLSMLFSAGMGTGLVFWSVAEPMSHFLEPPFSEGGTPAAAREAMRLTFYHWGLHPWAIYIVLGVALAYFHFRHDLPLAPRSVLYPLIGKRIYGPIGHAADILCTVGTLLGVATSLGLGAMQINAGIAEFMDIATAVPVQVAIIATITGVATLSVVSGIHSGIRRLSEINMGLAFLLMLFVFIAGPTIFQMEVFTTTIGLYLQHLPEMSFFADFSRDKDWQADWTFYYWGWWISWSPFVGIFIARISRGRTIREFTAMVLIVPTLGTFLWLSVFGGTGLHAELREGTDLATRISDDIAISLLAVLETLPLTALMQAFATLVIVVFFITSSDSGSLVDDMVTSGGDPNPPRAQRVFWAVSEGAVAATLLLVGGLRAIQDASIAMGLPMSVLLALATIGLGRSLAREARGMRFVPKEIRRETATGDD